MEMDLFSAEERGFVSCEHFLNEIITPLCVMYINIQWLQSGGLRKETVRRHVECIKSNWFQVMKVLNDTCDSRRISRGVLRPGFKKQDVVLLAQEITESAKMLCARRRLHLDFIHNAESCCAVTDKKICERIILNLLSNAFQRTDENGRVCLTVRRVGENIVVAVKDSGRAIPRPVLERIRLLLQNAIEPQALPKGYMWLLLMRDMAFLIGAVISYESFRNGVLAKLTIPITAAATVETSWPIFDSFYAENIRQFELQ